MRLPTWAWLLVDALAVYRLTRLVTLDYITEPWRRRLVKRHRAAFYFVQCPWCVSVWAGALAVVLTRWAAVPWSYVALALALSTAAGLISLVDH